MKHAGEQAERREDRDSAISAQRAGDAGCVEAGFKGGGGQHGEHRDDGGGDRRREETGLVGAAQPQAGAHADEHDEPGADEGVPSAREPVE